MSDNINEMAVIGKNKNEMGFVNAEQVNVLHYFGLKGAD